MEQQARDDQSDARAKSFGTSHGATEAARLGALWRLAEPL